MACMALFALKIDGTPAETWLNLAFLLVGLAGLIAIGVAVGKQAREMAKMNEDAPPEHSLEHYQQMFDDGLLEQNEFERIRARLDRNPPSAPPT